MSLVKKLLVPIIFLLTVIPVIVFAADNKAKVINTEVTTSKIELENEGFTKLYSNKNFNYFYKKHNGIFKVEDKRSGYVWKSGIDHDYDQYIEQSLELFISENPEATNEEILAVAKNKEEQMNNTREGIANSFIVVDVFTKTNVTRAPLQIGSSSKSFITVENSDKSTIEEKKSDSIDTDNLYIVNNDITHLMLKVKLKTHDININVNIYLNENGFDVEIKDADISGDDSKYIAYINIMPFLGSYGGKQSLYNQATGMWDTEVLKERKEGYALVPDGSGGLIYFKDYLSKLSGYTGDIYGKDLGQNNSQNIIESAIVPQKNPLMPLFGIAYEKENAAFVSFAKKGGENMQIISRPNDSSDSYNLTNYNITFSRYIYNKTYNQVYNKAGDVYLDFLEDRNKFDFIQSYYLLGNSDDERTDYIGMANAYKKYLIDSQILTLKNEKLDNIPIRIDFVMSDAKKNLFGYEDVVTTNINDVDNILSDLESSGVKNINSGLFGYQKGGITLGRKDKPKFKNKIGSKKEFKNIGNSLKDKNIDISLALDYSIITNEQTKLKNNAIKHINGWYLKEILNQTDSNMLSEKYFARPTKIASWIESNAKITNKMGLSDITLDGFTNKLYSDYTKGFLSKKEVISIYQNTLKELDNNTLNLTAPNQYLWEYTDRFLQTPMFTTQYLVETIEVPFLHLILNNTMELYSTYVNFSFYEPTDILKIIDYNVYPSFVLTKEPSYLLSETNSSNYFSTEYKIYEKMIKDVYENVNGALKNVSNANWINRTVTNDNLVINEYSNQIKILINYNNIDLTYNNNLIKANSYLVIGG